MKNEKDFKNKMKQIYKREEILNRGVAKAVQMATRAPGNNEIRSQYHGAVVIDIKTGKIVSSGCNSNCLERIKNENICTIHAEMDALRRFPRKIAHHCIMIVVRVSRTYRGGECYESHLKMSHPCKVCTPFLQKFGLLKIYYSET